MKINDVVYLVYTNSDSCLAFRVKLTTDFKKTTKRIHGPKGSTICDAKFLKRYQLETGWQTPEDIPKGQRSFTGTFSVSKNNLYDNWEDAKNEMRKNIDKRLVSIQYGLDTVKKRAEDAQQAVLKISKKLADTQALDLNDHFGDKNTSQTSYISPFTGKII